ncbi:MAG: glutathione S-transferase family protein [Burkholderiales bacterium]
MAIELYSWPRSSGTRVSWALEELGVPYKYVELDPKKKEHQAPKYLAINPHGKVPALVDEGQRFFESAAILLHLGETYGVAKKLWPAPGRQAHADALCWTVWASCELFAYMMQYLYHGMDTPVSYRPQDRSKAAAEYCLSQLARQLRALEAQLQERDYLFGGFSLADVAAGSALALGSSLGLGLEQYPRTAGWCRRCIDRPAFKRAR